ncbi:integrin alpha-X-like [Zonotrichia leucophrys gambelii]|uniref:integrin alpha-X-like n=1 Tax=Zonotrichia leucophrys gambelii TaxID=257770 RepID=UPI0031408227
MGPGQLLALLGTAALAGAGLDLETPAVFRGDPGGAFGASVAQLGSGSAGWLLVGAPHAGGGSGAVFGCKFGSENCEKIQISGPSGSGNSSLGLAMAAGDDAALVCGPSSPQVCGVNVHLNGFCVQLDTRLRPVRSLPDAFPECPKPSMDIAFLMDGSGSIARDDFGRMKTFIGAVMRRFRGADAQFSLTQFSHEVEDHFDFTEFRKVPDPWRLLDNVQQLRGATYTATGIRHVLRQMFGPGRGARPDARRILIVVTDGEKLGDSLDYPEVIKEADAMRVTRYAIGVGESFRRPELHRELQVIASSPAQDHLFRVDNFSALAGIQSQLQEKIFAIEGTQIHLGIPGYTHNTPGETPSTECLLCQLEMAQAGISATLSPAGPVLGAVGAFDWSGGAFAYGGGGAEPEFLNGSAPRPGTPGAHLEGARDAYLGYAATPLSLGRTWGLALGAPRWGHLGQVKVLEKGDTWRVLGEATGTQVGSYFGASLLALEPCPGEPRPGEQPRPRPGEPQVRLLVGEPLFYGGGSGGRVHLCEIQGQVPRLRCRPSLQGSPGHPHGRFGASLAHLPQVGGARCAQVAVGAPLEDEGRGAVYLFSSTPAGIDGNGQRVAGSSFPSQPRFFGQSLSGGRDLSGDHLPDLAVGARGQVLLLRSPPLLRVRLRVTFDPAVIPARECPEGAELRERLGVARVCFRVTKETRDSLGAVSASLWFRAELDPGRARVRADFGAENAKNGTLSVGEGQRCQSLEIFYKGCPQDTLTPLTLRVTLGGRGDPLEAAGGLRPQLGPGSDTAVTATLPFEHDCGADNACQDRLELQLSLVGPGVLLVGQGDALELTLTVTNAGESSFGPGVTLEHPAPLSFRKVQMLQPRGSVRCHSEPPEGRGRRSLCWAQPPVLRAGAQVSFRLTLDVPPDAELGQTLQVTAQSHSSNGGAGGRSQSATIPVRYQVFLVIDSAADSSRYLNVTAGGAPPPPAPVSHHYQVKVLGRRPLPADVTFWVPAHLGQVRLWESLGITPEQEQPRCREGPEEPGEDPERPLLSCPGAPCRTFRCSLPPLEPPRTWGFHLGGKLNLEWVRQVPWPKVHLQSSARVSFDQRTFQNTWGGTELQVQTELERVQTPNPLPVIVGASLGGLLLLALVALGLYKVGKNRGLGGRWADSGGAGPPQADSGGAVTCGGFPGGRWVQFGVLSFALGCARPNGPALATALAGAHARWLRRRLPPGAFLSAPPGPPPDPRAEIGLCYGCGSMGGPALPLPPPPRWPWGVTLRGEGRRCGGALLGGAWVLTAASCFLGAQDPEAWEAELWGAELGGPAPSPSAPSPSHSNHSHYGPALLGPAPSPPSPAPRGSRLHLHGAFAGAGPEGAGPDLALLELRPPPTWGPHLRPLCAPYREHLATPTLPLATPTAYRGTCWALLPDPRDPARLRPAQVVPERCPQNPELFCTNGTRPEQEEFLGSPLACEERGLWFLVGVAAPRKGRGPPAFTWVPPQERWIAGVARGGVLFAEPPPDPRDEEREEREGDPEIGGGDPENWGDPEMGENPEFGGVWGRLNGSGSAGNWGNPVTSPEPENPGTPGDLGNPVTSPNPENRGSRDLGTP